MREERIAKLKQMIEREPNDSFTLYALALEYASLGATEEAVSRLEALLKQDPGYIPSYQQLGYLYMKLDRRVDSIAIFKRGIEVARQQGDVHARSEMQDALDELEL